MEVPRQRRGVRLLTLLSMDADAIKDKKPRRGKLIVDGFQFRSGKS